MKRIIVKLSGELLGESKIEFDKALEIAKTLIECKKMGYEIGVVIGGGNIWRGRSHKEMDAFSSDSIGMLATTMNAIALKSAINALNEDAIVMSSIDVKLVSRYNVDEAKEKIKNNIVIFAGGLGTPCLSTDTTAATRAVELNSDLILKGTNVDGVYDSDPKVNISAKKYDKLTFKEALEKRLKIMDAAAFDICLNNNLKVCVFNLNDLNNIKRICNGETIGTIVSNYE